MLLVLDVEVVEDLALLGLGDVGVVVLCVEFALPDLDVTVLLLDQLYEVLVLLHEVGVLGQQQLYLLLQVVDLLRLPQLVVQLLGHLDQFLLELPALASPVVHLPGRGVAAPSRGRVVANVRAARVGLVGRSGVVLTTS